MFESLFGAETPLAVRFFIAFVVVFGLIGATAWLVRRFGTTRLGEAARGRQPRLAVIEAGAVDGRRRLVLVRRDNVEHLLLIGGPSDIVVEQNIVRGQSSGVREMASPRGTGMADSLARPTPLGEPNTWPLAPEPAPRAARGSDEPEWPGDPEIAAPGRRGRPDLLSGLAAELSTREQPSRGNGHSEAPIVRAPELPRAAPAHAPAATATPSPSDQNLAEMAQRLEAALRRPAAPKPAPTPMPMPGSQRMEAAPRVEPASPPTAPAAAPSAQPKASLSSIEEEMANLLGRQPGKG